MGAIPNALSVIDARTMDAMRAFWLAFLMAAVCFLPSSLSAQEARFGD